jgi:hypothetical protein
MKQARALPSDGIQVPVFNQAVKKTLVALLVVVAAFLDAHNKLVGKVNAVPARVLPN